MDVDSFDFADPAIRGRVFLLLLFQMNSQPGVSIFEKKLKLSSGVTARLYPHQAGRSAGIRFGEWPKQ